jgi:hypothetical protein
LEVLDEDPFGALDCDRQSCSVLGERGVELGQAGDVVGDALLG